MVCRGLSQRLPSVTHSPNLASLAVRLLAAEGEVTKTADPPRIPIFARIRSDLRDQLKESQDANGRTWEREVEEAIRFYLEHGQ